MAPKPVAQDATSSASTTAMVNAGLPNPDTPTTTETGSARSEPSSEIVGEGGEGGEGPYERHRLRAALPDAARRLLGA